MVESFNKNRVTISVESKGPSRSSTITILNGRAALGASFFAADATVRLGVASAWRWYGRTPPPSAVMLGRTRSTPGSAFSIAPGGFGTGVRAVLSIIVRQFGESSDECKQRTEDAAN